jgi:hypothetical protein
MDEAEIKSIIEKQGKSMSDTMSKLIKDLKKGGLSESEIKRVNQALKDEIKLLKLKDTAEKKAISALDDYTQEQIKLVKASKDLNEKLYQLASSTGLNVVESQRLADRAVAAKDTLEKLGKAAEAGSGKIDDYTSAFKGRLSGFGDVISGIGSRLEANVDTYRTLSSVGASFGQDLVKLRETAAAAGLPIEDFSKLIQKNSQSLAALFGSSTQGAIQFSKLSSEFRRTNIDVLAPLGFTVDEINDTLLTNLTMQRRTGNFVEGADQEQIQSAQSFALELDKLSKLTGIQRSELTKQLESQTKNERFLAFLNTQTDETRQRLQTFAGAVGKIAPGLEEGFQDLIANAGVPVTAAARALIQNIPDATAIVQQLSAGGLSTTDAMLQLKDAAQRSNKMFGAVAQTGTVEFARLYGEVNKLASANMDAAAVTNEQRKRASLLTQQLTEFQDASKKLSSSFQSLETGFFGAIGDTIGIGIGGINISMKALATGVNNMNNASKALLYAGTQIGGFVLDKATQVGVVFTGTLSALKAAGMGSGSVAGNIGNMWQAGKTTAGKAAPRMMTAGKFGAGALATGLAASAVGNDSIAGKVLDVGSYALTGASLGSLAGPIGTAVGAAIGTGIGLVNQAGGISGIMESLGKPSRATGTLGETGLPFEAKTSMLKVHAGERVLNAQETVDYNKSGPDAGQTQHMAEYNQTAKELLEATKATNALLNKQVAIAMATEKNTKKTSKVVDKVGPSIV